MGTKQNPGEFDCLDKIYDDEPFFVIRAKDPVAERVIRYWVYLRIEKWIRENPGRNRDEIPVEYQRKLEEADQCSIDVSNWRRDNPDRRKD